MKTAEKAVFILGIAVLVSSFLISPSDGRGYFPQWRKRLTPLIDPGSESAENNVDKPPIDGSGSEPFEGLDCNIVCEMYTVCKIGCANNPLEIDCSACEDESLVKPCGCGIISAVPS